MTQLTLKNLFMKEKPFHMSAAWILGLLIWALAVGYGFSQLLRYEAAPGKAAPQVPEAWPAQSGIPAPSEMPSLLLFAHPQCPCTRASIAELEKLMTVLQGRMKAYVVFVTPRGFSDAQVKDGLWKKTERIPGVTLFADVKNAEAGLFGSGTSGEAFLYTPDGKLVFHGGITGGRGHEGVNAGSDTVKHFVLHGKSMNAHTPIFGCSLWDRKTRKDR